MLDIHFIRENLGLGSPEEVQLIFNRPITRRTPGLFRTRIVSKDVIPSLHVYYKNTRIKQYHKEERALRTETTINNTYDFGIGRRLHNLPKLRQIGFAVKIGAWIFLGDSQMETARCRKFFAAAATPGLGPL